MAQYEALRSFGGKVSGTKGRPVEITDKKVAEDLLEAGYIKAVGGKTPAADKPAAKPAAKPADKPAEAPAPVEEPAGDKPAETPEQPEQPTEEKEAPAAPEATK